MDGNLDKRYQTLVVLWFALLMNVVILFLVTLFAAPQDQDGPVNSVVNFVLAGVGTLLVVLSFVVKRKLLERSIDKQDVSLVQKALVIASAMCEVTALIGLLERFIIGSGDYFVLFVVAAIGTALHFPRREQLQAATYKDSAGA